MDPSDTVAYHGMMRSQVLLGRYDEAIATWRLLAQRQRDARTDSMLARAKGASGYWSVRHAYSAPYLAQLEARAAKEWVSPLSLALARMAVGDTARALQELEHLDPASSPRLSLLPCLPGIDEVRNSPRMRAIIERVGPHFSPDQRPAPALRPVPAAPRQ